MKMTQLFLDELDREAARTRRALENVPPGHDDWKPHDEVDAALARLAGLVASMPSWVTLIIEQDELDLTPPQGGGQIPAAGHQSARRDAGRPRGEGARVVVEDERRLPADHQLAAACRRPGGLEQPRHIVLRDTLNHLAHHRGQLTVYLRC